MKKAHYLLTKITFLLALSFAAFFASAQQTADTLKEKAIEMNERINGIDERLLTTESDVAKHNKIKISGYIQAQYNHFENPAVYPSNTFLIRRARVKLAYEAAEGVKFLIVPDFTPGAFDIKEAYAQLNDRWTKTMSLWVGKFNRPNYDVEYSSSQNELLERSRVIQALYPGEYAIGAKLEYKPLQIPLKVQVAMLNGNDYQIYLDANKNNFNNTNRDYDNYKDLMIRGTYSLKLGSFGGLDFGAHGYFGGVKSNSTTTINGKYEKESDATLTEKLTRQWIGAEFQLYADVLGGLALKGEYITGTNSTPGYMMSPVTTTVNSSSLQNDTLTLTTTKTTSTTIAPNMTTNFSGGYISLIKNIGKKFQIAARYEFYDPNTSLKGSDLGIAKYTDPSNGTVSSSSSTSSVNGSQVIINKTITNTTTSFTAKSGKGDMQLNTLMLAMHYYFDDNIRVSLGYEIPMNEKSNPGKLVDTPTVNGEKYTLDYANKIPLNTLTIRVQAKF